MKRPTLSWTALCLTLALGPISSLAGEFALKDGRVVVGRIVEIMGQNVTIAQSESEREVHAIPDFEQPSQNAIATWRKRNPEAVDVFSHWDDQPVIKSSLKPKLPSAFRFKPFKGMVSVDMVLDENGRVIAAKARKSTHPELIEPTIRGGEGVALRTSED